jgi:UDP-N-acetylmuramoyl-tripeptide--D-alanyl-D-alanine ligase
MELSKHPVWSGVNPLKKRGHLARFFLARHYARLFPREIFVGITGTVGKTATAVASTAVLREKYSVLSTTETMPGVKNLDPIFNLPMTLLKVKKSIKKVILEMGIEHPGEMDLYLGLVKPATAIVTMINYAHSQFLGDIDSIAKEKGKLVEQLPEKGFAILNWDDPNTRKLAEKTAAQVIYYGKDQKNCHVWADNLRIENFRLVFELNYGVERVEVRSQLLGFHQVYSLLAAAALGLSLEMPLFTIKKGLEKVEQLEHRMEVRPGYNNSIIIDDSYNGAPIAVEEAVETLNQVPARRRIVVLGEMRELGEFSERMHRGIARTLYKEKVDLVLTGKGEAEIISDELLKLGFIPERLSSGMTNPEIVAKLLKILAKGDVVLIKGAQLTRMDEVAERLVKQKK